MAQVLLQIYFLLTTLSVIFLGINCVLFLFCIYVLWGQQSRSHRILLGSGIVQFCLCLAQTILFITDFGIAYTSVHAHGGEQSHFEILRGYALPCYIIYILNNMIEGSLLIWRVLILSSHNVIVCVPLVALLALQAAFAGVTAKGTATENINGAHSTRVFSLITWSLIVAVNVSATALICLRLWAAHRNAKLSLSPSKYKSALIVVVECGALVTVCTVAMLILHAVEKVVGLADVGITTQAATMAPLLIIARHGILSRQAEARRTAQIPLRIIVARTEDTHVDARVEFTEQHKRLRLNSVSTARQGDHLNKPFSDA